MCPATALNKLNYSFAVGGAALTIKTVEQLTGVDIDHYLEVDFNAFKDITDSLGGVYVDVDQRYYNDNPEFELIKLAPGYQLLKGDDALDYVRYRHDLNLDFGRMERQQTFLTAMREQAMGWDLPLKLPGLVGAMFSNVTTDLGANDFIRLAYWGSQAGRGAYAADHRRRRRPRRGWSLLRVCRRAGYRGRGDRLTDRPRDRYDDRDRRAPAPHPPPPRRWPRPISPGWR